MQLSIGYCGPRSIPSWEVGSVWFELCCLVYLNAMQNDLDFSFNQIIFPLLHTCTHSHVVTGILLKGLVLQKVFGCSCFRYSGPQD